MLILNLIGLFLIVLVIISIIEDVRLEGYRDKFTGRPKNNREK